MQMKNFIIIVVFVSLVSTRVTPQITLDKFNQWKKSIVRVDANQCGGIDRSASGFLWKQTTWVVTTLHVVNGCGKMSVYSEATGSTKKATILRVLPRQDLVLLQIDTIAGSALLNVAQASPSATDELQVLGYPLAIPRMDNTTVRLRYGGRTLRDIVPQAVAEELKNLGSPDPNIAITDIEGHLLPGHSGAPILNGSGEVVAIADGGLENGAVGVSWGLPAATLAMLAISTETLPANASASNAHLFSAETTAQNGPDITCGGNTFKKIRTLVFGDIRHATDDPLGLEQLLTAVGPAAYSFQFDVYQQISNGATFVVPKDAVLIDSSGMCVSTSGNVVIRVALTVNPQDPAGQASSVQYESRMLNSPGWQPDPGWTYLFPSRRFDGFVARRKSFIHAVLTPYYGLVQDQELFETLVARKGVFLGVSALNPNSTPNVVQTQQACKFNPQVSPYCGQALADLQEWDKAVIAVHLSTIPVG
jgi:hypothetical protein